MIHPVPSPTGTSTRWNQDHDNDNASNDSKSSTSSNNNNNNYHDYNHNGYHSNDDDEIEVEEEVDGEMTMVAPVVVDWNATGTAATATTTTIPNRRGRMDWICRLTWLLTLIVIAAITVIGVLIWNMHRPSKDDESNGTSTSSTTGSKNLLPLDQYYDLLSQHLSRVRHVNGLTDPQTDAYKTLEWMAFEDGAVQQLLLLLSPQESPPKKGSSTTTTTLNVPAVEQRVAIAMLFFATAGADFWNTDWLLPGKHECTLDGITCNDEHQIVQIVLVERSLLGTLPSELSWLSSLQHLDLHQNRIYGTLPTAFFTSSWTQLNYLDISFNSMTGSLPSDWSALIHLHDFAAQLNSLTGPLPRQLPLSLEYFSADGNRLNGTIPWNDWHDYLISIQGQENNSRTINNNNNDTTTTTTTNKNVTKGFGLTLLDVGANANIDGIISPLIATLFPQMVSFGLYRTNVHGTLPTQMGQLMSLEELSLAGCKITGTIPTTLYQLSNLQWLVAASTKLEGTLSTQVSHLSSLQVLNLMNTLLTGTLPTELGSLSHLEWLQVSDSNLQGTIPTELGQLSQLSRLWIQNTKLHGTFPSEVCQVPAIQDDLRVDCDKGFPVSCNCCNYCY